MDKGVSAVKNIICTILNCKVSFPSERCLSNHIRTIHIAANSYSAEVNYDPDVKLVDCRSNAIKQSKKWQRREKLCQNCGEWRKDIWRHRQTCMNSGERKFHCKVAYCKLSFTTQNYLNRHLAKVHVPLMECPYDGCGAFLKPMSFYLHEKMVHTKIMKTCEDCGKWVLEHNHSKMCSARITKFSCKHCKLSFPSRSKLIVHVRQAHTAPIKCPEENCGKMVSLNHLSLHIKVVHEKARRSCQKCGKTISFQNMSRHRKTCENNSKNFRCDVEDCGASFALKQYLQSHIQGVHGESVKCLQEGCNAYVKPNNLINHLKFMHDKVGRVCGNCGRRPVDLDRHLKTCSGTDATLFRCSVSENCQSAFTTKKGLEMHVLRYHDEVKCPRNGCEEFMNPFYLDAHLKSSHDNVVVEPPMEQNTDKSEKIRCEEDDCMASFEDESQLELHVKKFHQQERIKCPHEGCNAYLRPRCLNIHEKNIHQKARKKCNRCGKKVRPENLNSHFKRCTKGAVKKFYCKVEGCAVSCVLSSDLKIHVRKVHSAPVKCPHEGCNSMMRQCSLLRHLKTVHQKVTVLCKICGEEVPFRYLEKQHVCKGKISKSPTPDIAAEGVEFDLH